MNEAKIASVLRTLLMHVNELKSLITLIRAFNPFNILHRLKTYQL